MAHQIEILSIGGDFDAQIEEAAQILNGAQEEFHFHLPPERLRGEGRSHVEAFYSTGKVFKLLKKYRARAKGDRRFVIGVIDRRLESSSNSDMKKLFGSHNARRGEGEAVITLFDHGHFVESTKLYLCYYFIRYALSFVCPNLKNHEDTRSCFFDRKNRKADIKKSIDSGVFCPDCKRVLWKAFNEEINFGIQRMIKMMKALRADSQDSLPAKSLHGQVDVGIITIKEEEFEAMLDRFPSHQHVEGSGSDYEYATVKVNGGGNLRVAVARSPDQGQGSAQAVTSSMITDLAPRWIFVVGIAGAFPASEYSLGDVLLSQRMHDFAVSAATEGKRPTFQDMGGPMALEVEKLVVGLKGRRAQLGKWSDPSFLGKSKPALKAPKTKSHSKLYGKDDWKSDVLKSLNKHFPENGIVRMPGFFAAVIIAGNTLLKDTKLARIWLQTARQASGVEMELGGVCRAARAHGGAHTKVLAIRGISDV